MAAPTIKNKLVTTGGVAATTVSVTLPTLQDGDTCAIFIGRATNILLTGAGTNSALGFTRYASRVGSASTAAQGELWVATGLTAASSGATVTWTGATNRTWRAVAFALDPCNMAVFTSSGTEAAGAWTWTAAAGNQSQALPSVDAATEALLLAALFDITNNTRTVSGTGWTEEDDGIAATNICHVSIASKTVAAAGTYTGPTVARDDTLNTAGSYPYGTVAFVSAASNVLPEVTAIAQNVAGVVGQAVTFGVTAVDPDGTIVSYDASQVTTGTTRTAPSLTNNGDGTFTFTDTAPAAYAFDVTATDNDGGESAAARVSVIVTAAAPSGGVGQLVLGRRRQGGGLRGLGG